MLETCLTRNCLNQKRVRERKGEDGAGGKRKEEEVWIILKRAV